MASGKRPAHFEGYNRNDEAPRNTSKRRQGDSVLTQIGVPRSSDIIRGDKRLVEKIFVPMIRKTVGEEVTAALGRFFNPCPSRQRQRSLQLRFKESPGKTYTGKNVKAKNMTSLEVALYQCERIVTEGPMSSAKIELCVLQGSFGRRADWSSEDFLRNKLDRTRKKGQLLTGNLSLSLINGVCTVEDLYVHDISTWAQTGKFRLGAKVAESTPETENIREAISQPFRVKHCRGQSYQKNDTPSLNDEIWRLGHIGKNGKRHKLLQSKGINTVEAFLHRLNTDPNQLKQDLQTIGVGEKKWEKLVHHAEKAWPRQDAGQPYRLTTPINSEPQNLVQAAHSLPQHESQHAAPQGLGVPSTSTSHFGGAVHVGQTDAGDDLDFNLLDELLSNSFARDGHSNYECPCPNFGVYMSSRGGCTTIWGQIRSVFKTTSAPASSPKEDKTCLP